MTGSAATTGTTIDRESSISKPIRRERDFGRRPADLARLRRIGELILERDLDRLLGIQAVDRLRLHLGPVDRERHLHVQPRCAALMSHLGDEAGRRRDIGQPIEQPEFRDRGVLRVASRQIDDLQFRQVFQLRRE